MENGKIKSVQGRESNPHPSAYRADINIPFILKRLEFPLGLAFPMTINKAKGQTFARVGLLLQEPVFMHGQLDVAFSHVRTLDSIHVKVEQEEKTMNMKKEATTQVGSFFVQHLPRNPSMFSGEGVEDPRSWLKGYEHVAKNNQ
ncbi:hypothetical protein LAZ67_8001197 [Cordylochernes scorpioides]|uniref:ATP-dependent DNA helicase n=1 Tax=Cordylochernes scorpioides TaxID=51811 RepID=A0ABY6KQ06_9ARAC|nr:hypothetical protein LAZ67_8001197 [Cordylochernes scorpioides]